MVTTVVLADDHNVVRQGMRHLLELDPAISVVGEVDNGVEAVQVVSELRPDVLVLDLSMPDLNGLEVTQELARLQVTTRILILSMYSDDEYVTSALKNGAIGYMVKESTGTELLKGIKEVAAGRIYLSPIISSRAIRSYVQHLREPIDDLADRLTAREREVFHLAAVGCSNTEIADRLSIRPRTAETHRRNLMHKLDIHSQNALVRFARENGIVPPLVEHKSKTDA